MLGTQFYNQAVRKTVVSFGTLFNNIELKKNEELRNQKVIHLSNQEKIVMSSMVRTYL